MGSEMCIRDRASPLRAQATVAGLRALVGGKKSDLDLVFIQHVSHQRRNSHVAGVQRQIDGFAGRFGRLRRVLCGFLCIVFACSPSRMGASSYKKNSNQCLQQTSRSGGRLELFKQAGAAEPALPGRRRSGPLGGAGSYTQ